LTKNEGGENVMNLKIVKSLLLFALFCSAIFAVTMLSTDLYAVHAMTYNRTTLTYVSGPVGGGYAPCGGDGVGGGHPCGNQTV